MKSKTAASIFAIFGHSFAWVWMVGGLAATYFFIIALFFDGAWSNFFWAFGASIIGKWLSKGFMDNKNRVLYEQKLISEGMTPDEAARKWIEEYSKK